jgi:hypothetical protein
VAAPKVVLCDLCGHALVLVVITLLSLGMQEEAAPGHRLRFGPDAYWKDAMAVMGRWDAVGLTDTLGGESDGTSQEIATIVFARDRSAIVVFKSGEQVVDAHRWFHADSRIHLDWHGRNKEHPDAAVVVMQVQDDRLYVPWPPGEDGGQYLLLKRQP